MSVAASTQELDLGAWRESDLLTSTLWLLGDRAANGVSITDFHGSFAPQIPNQVLRRFTKPGELVLDLFLGSGTTLAECRRLGRHGLGVDCNPATVATARAALAALPNPHAVQCDVLVGDARTEETERLALSWLLGRRDDCLGADLVLLHPPYHDLVDFGGAPGDLSRCESQGAFLLAMREVASRAYTLCRPGGTVVLVIGDGYRDGEVDLLGFQTLQVLRQSGLRLKAICVKDLGGHTRGKGVATNLWRYRALRNGLYTFAHEYIGVYQRPLKKGRLRP